MSKQLSLSATASVLAMALFALIANLGGNQPAATGGDLPAAPVASITG